ncbi:DUF4129 domain-containing protein [Brevibacillus dissolubilis]|uniref:DUF4129 domain-containing protein n=1 Tax=Brevibacillus dissolubilis TaxID=1844116 RepID=UPI0011160FEC|nr:DUF4129 domain-containing protein [Brevibacillus dissolubilis]
MRWDQSLRWMLMLSLEAHLGVALLVLLGFLSADFGTMLALAVGGSLLLALGGWLYQGGGRSMVLVVMLYPLVAVVGLVSYLLVGSALVAVVLAGLFYWRIMTVVPLQLYDYDYLRRFFSTAVVYGATLAIMAFSDKGHTADVFGMLAVLVGWYALVGYGEYLTRELPSGMSVDQRMLARLTWQQAQVQLGLTALYALAGSLVLGVLWGVWLLLQDPAKAVASYIFTPLFQLLEGGLAQLTEKTSQNKKVQDLLQPGGSDHPGADGSLADGPSLATLAMPYITGGLVLIAVLAISWWIWKRRNMSQIDAPPAPVTTAAPAQVSVIHPADTGSDGQSDQLRSLETKWSVPKDDPVRHTYYLFLRYMAGQGLVIEPDETSQEFLRRVRAVWTDAARILLAESITRVYEQHRYGQGGIKQEDIAQLLEDFHALESAP